LGIEDFKSFPYAPESSLVSQTSEMPKKKKERRRNGKDKHTWIMLCRSSSRLKSSAREDFKYFSYAPESSLVSQTSEMPTQKRYKGID